MSKVIVIVGLPGSGKSVLADSLVIPNVTNWTVFDDPATSLEKLKALKDHLKNDYDAVITDIYATEPSIREVMEMELKLWGAEIEWIFFSNEPEACIDNIARRTVAGDDRRVSPGYVREASKNYVIPEDAKRIIPVWREKT